MSGTRVEGLASQLEEAGVDVYFAQTPVSMGYLQNYWEHSGERFLTLAIHRDGRMRMIAPALSVSQARRVGIQDIRSWKDGEDPLAHFAELAEDWKLKTSILAVDDEMPAQMLLRMQDALPAALFRAGSPILGALRRRKEPQELELLHKAGRIADEAFQIVSPQIRAGMTERHVSKLLTDAMTSLGGEPYFSIVATGANAAEPHHLSDDTVIQRGDGLILDFGCDLDGYKSDITRTVAVGYAPERLSSVYAIVYDAHMAARRAIRAGVQSQAVDAQARQTIEKAGFGEFFFHRTGHGIGLQGHESPDIAAGSEFELEATNCFSIEPGIYLAGELGVRIENIVFATEEGHVSFNDEPSEVISCVDEG